MLSKSCAVLVAGSPAREWVVACGVGASSVARDLFASARWKRACGHLGSIKESFHVQTFVCKAGPD